MFRNYSFGNVIKGANAEITVTARNSVSTLYLNNVQGEEFTTGQPLVVYEGSTVSYGSQLLHHRQYMMISMLVMFLRLNITITVCILILT